MIDVVILTHGQPELLQRFIEGLLEHEDPKTLRLIWIDNGSSAADCSKMAEIVDTGRPGMIGAEMIFNPDNRGFPRAINQGLRHVTSPFVCICNNDTRLLNPALSIMRDRLAAHPGVAAIGPVSIGGGWQEWSRTPALTAPQRWSFERCIGDKARGRFLREQLGHLLWRVPQNEWLAFFCTMFPRWALDEVGLLDERFGMGFAEDDQWCDRARLAGYEIAIAPGALVEHKHRATWHKTLGVERTRALQAKSTAELHRWRREVGIE